MLSINVNEREIRELYLKELHAHIKKIDSSLVFWDRKELERRTCMSWDSIQKQFFYDSRFPKCKIGQKWYFPAKAAEKFLLSWIEEQSIG
jgi:hypothetical protein